jgi:hypothetical protein
MTVNEEVHKEGILSKLIDGICAAWHESTNQVTFYIHL